MKIRESFAPILGSVFVWAGLMIPAPGEIHTLLSDQNFAGAARWSLLGVDDGGASWRENGWASRFSAVDDANGTGPIAAEEYFGLADVGGKYWGLLDNGASWLIVGFDRFGVYDGTSFTLQGVSPATHAYLGMAGDETTGALYVFRNDGGWTADRFNPDGTLSAASAVSFGAVDHSYKGWARTSSSEFLALRSGPGASPYRVVAYDASGSDLGDVRSLKDQSGVDVPAERVLKGFSSSGAVQPIEGDVMGPFLNGSFAGFAKSHSAQGKFKVVPAFPNLQFTEPSAMVADPTGPRFFVSERTGILSWVSNDESTTQKNVMLDIEHGVAGGGEVAVLSHETGFYNFILHPDFAQNGFLYAFYTWCTTGNDIPRDFAQSNGHTGIYVRLSRFTVDHQNLTIDPASELVMLHLRWENGSHKGGGMVFAEDGFLYVTISDMFIDALAETISDNFAGGVIRVDVDMQGGAVSHAPNRRMGIDAGMPDEISGVGYYIPNDNPFNHPNGSVFEEFYAVGHRNPYRMTIDVPTGNIWISEVGDQIEEISLLDRNGGGNGQWPYDEGFDDDPAGQPPGILGVENPAVMEFTRTEARAVIGGHVYRGTKFPDLVGKYIFGDYVFGTLWAATYDEVSDAASREEIGKAVFVAGFGEDPFNGEVYLFDASAEGTHVTGLSKLEANVASPGHQAPALLSDTGLFANLTTLEPAPGVYPFKPIAPLWSDDALKKRWVAVPSDGRRDSPAFERLTFSEEGNYKCPVGTVLIKHFDMGSRRVETRFTVLGPEETWTALTYKWRPDGSDADLVPPEGEDIVFAEGGQVYNWNLPSQGACFLCHTEASDFVLGLRTRMINSDEDFGGVVQNQLLWMNDRDLFDVELDAPTVAGFLTAAHLSDNTASLEKRVRSYLDSNCAHCHQPGGGAGRAAWNGLLPVSLSETGLMYGSVVVPVNDPVHERLVVPRYPELSQLYLRLEAGNPCCSMPPIAVNVTDEAARTVVESWILGLSGMSSTSSFARPVDVIASTTWDSGGPGSATGSPDVWALHLIQEPGTAIGSATPDETLSEESASATHPEHAGGDAFGQWHSADGDTTGYVLFDLGATMNLETIHLWQANQTGLLGSGVQQLDVLVANDPSAFSPAEVGNPLLWTEALADQVMTVSPGGAITSQDFALGGFAARYVQLNVESNYGGNNTGLSEVRFTTFIDGDADGDGHADAAEGLDDVDGDGVPNLLDLFSDGDHVTDSAEGGADFDLDGVPDYLDIDNDNDGIHDMLECPQQGGASCDPDGDGFDSSYDLDSDNDGISDADEASGDLDHDGFTGLEELMFGTDPELTADAPAWRVEQPGDPGTPWGIAVHAVEDRSYTLQGGEVLTGFWDDLTTLGDVGSAGEITLFDPLPSGSRSAPRYFYRLGVKVHPK